MQYLTQIEKGLNLYNESKIIAQDKTRKKKLENSKNTKKRLLKAKGTNCQNDLQLQYVS